MAKPKLSPAVHSKNAATGKGIEPKTPGNANLAGSNHVPKTGTSDYSNEQQQKQ